MEIKITRILIQEDCVCHVWPSENS